MATTARTPRVQLVLNVREEVPQEHVVKVTTGHEVVEARRNGVPFLFKRKRGNALPPADAAVVPPLGPAASTRTKSHPLKTPAAAQLAQQAATAAAAAESPYADELELPQALGQWLVEGMAALSEHAAPTERLLAFCSSLGTASAEVAAAQVGGAAKATTLADTFAAFQQALAAALSDGSIQVVAPPRAPAPLLDDGEVEQPDYQVDLQARKAGLRARLANFQKEEQEWQGLLEQVEQLDQQQLAAAAAPAGEAPTTGVSEAGAEAGTAAGQEAGDEDLVVLAQLHAGLHRRLAMQVEGVCKLVGDVEEMVARANRSAQAVQAEYHAEKFRVFPHVDSPARLIKELVRPGGKAPQQPAQQLATDKENAVALA